MQLANDKSPNRYDINVANQKSVNGQKTRYFNVANFKSTKSQSEPNITLI